MKMIKKIKQIKRNRKKNRLVYESAAGYKIVRANWLSNLLWCPINGRYRYYLLAPGKLTPVCGNHWLWYVYQCLAEEDKTFDPSYSITKNGFCQL